MSDSSAKSITALAASLTGLATVTVGLRFWARRRNKLQLLADDWLAAFALLTFIAASIITFVGVRGKNLGYSSHDFTPEETLENGRKHPETVIALELFTNNTLACVKLSALFFYRRIFCAGGKKTALGTAIWATIAVVVLWTLIFQPLIGFQCGSHFSSFWDGTFYDHCTIAYPVLFGLVISNFLIDIWILLLPIPSILRLNTNLRKKLSIIGVFLLAFVGVLASIGRIVQYVQIEVGGADYLLKGDLEQSLTRAFFYTLLESGISIIAVNLPSIRSLFANTKTMQSMRNLMLRSHTTNNTPSSSGVPLSDRINKGRRPESFTSHHSQSSLASHTDLLNPPSRLSQDLERQL
ncbi:hypothetical protein F4808DRAFT_439944 [Astrocystis sublimbata]|nr:hypothetical protein F4808DRAFT_439944 [Astrocystis sublimbata]